MNTNWDAWAEGLSAAANRVGMNTTPDDFPRPRRGWTEDMDFDVTLAPATDYDCDRAADAYEKSLGL